MFTLFKPAAPKAETPELVRRADSFAALAHGATGQVRRYSGEPYIVHPRSVAARVRLVPGHSPEWIAAALLHDCPAETAHGVAEIREHFGNEVATLVDGVTEQAPAGLDGRARRKRYEAERLAACPAPVQTLKVADFLDNAFELVRLDPRFAQTYLPENLYLIERLEKAYEPFREKAMALIESGLRQLSFV